MTNRPTSLNTTILSALLISIPFINVGLFIWVIYQHLCLRGFKLFPTHPPSKKKKKSATLDVCLFSCFSEALKMLSFRKFILLASECELPLSWNPLLFDLVKVRVLPPCFLRDLCRIPILKYHFEGRFLQMRTRFGFCANTEIEIHWQFYIRNILRRSSKLTLTCLGNFS